ncbi:unnamed protein product [Orchesella dallaii]|uniref:ClpA/ClpB AAA lid domain-containing protein n=1 Tax=Orchesella dallaii TaxID=48710 RepID=A0ABP1PZK8_9HEXA
MLGVQAIGAMSKRIGLARSQPDKPFDLLDGVAAKKRIERLEEPSKFHDFNANTSIACDPSCKHGQCDNQYHTASTLNKNWRCWRQGYWEKGCVQSTTKKSSVCCRI